jgi:pSer/pThr/pTyr-binding forkhead associated (FHA) protein
MSKLILFLPDDSTLDIPLDRERLTIGRRAGNDVVLPNLAVSGEHAAIVTILADSFLEDLNSTNGTLVNGDPVAKHFLRDRDEIDVGRHKLIYCVDDEAVIESKNLEGRARVTEHDFGGRVEAAKPFVKRRDEKAADTPAPEVLDPPRAAPAKRPVAQPLEALVEPPPPEPEPAPLVQPIGPAVIDGPAIRILSGVRAGKMVALTKDETTIGRPGVQVATIVRAENGFRIKPLEGISPPAVNGQAVGADGVELKPGDTVEIVNARAEFVDPTSSGTSSPAA